MKKLFISLTAALFFFSWHAAPTIAAGTSSCYQLYNGGVTDQQYCPTPAPITTGANSQTPQQTKGGQIIYPSSKSQTTPNTGPSLWSLVSIFAAGVLGLWLRKQKYV